MNAVVIDSNSLLCLIICGDSIVSRIKKRSFFHAEYLLMHIKNMLNIYSINFSDLDYVFVLYSVRNYTGFKVCVSFVYALKVLYRIKLLVISKFLIIAYLLNTDNLSVVFSDKMGNKFFQNFNGVIPITQEKKLIDKNILLHKVVCGRDEDLYSSMSKFSTEILNDIISSIYYGGYS